MNTESFLEGVLLDGIEAGATPPFSLRLSKAPKLTEGYLTLSPKTTNQEIVKYSGVSGSTVTVTDRGYDSTGTGKNVSNQKKHSKNTSAFKGALNHLIIDGKASSEDIQLVRDDLASNANAKGASLVGVEDVGGYFTSTDVEGALAELAASVVVPNASTTESGKVELPTDTEVTNGTATGGTGATLTPTNAQLNKSISLKGSTSTTTDTNEFVVNQGGVDKRITQANLRTQLAGDETKLGTAQKATNAEATAGVEDTKYITSKQVADNYKPTSTSVFAQKPLGTPSLVYNHNLGRVPHFISIYAQNDIDPSKFSHGVYTSDGTQKCLKSNGGGQSGFIVSVEQSSGGNDGLVQISNITSTQFTLTYSVTGTPYNDYFGMLITLQA